MWDVFFALAKLNEGRTNLRQPPVADALSEVRSSETSNLPCGELRRLRMRASSATLTNSAEPSARLRAGNACIAVRNPRFPKGTARGVWNEATPERKRRPQMDDFRLEIVLIQMIHGRIRGIVRGNSPCHFTRN